MQITRNSPTPFAAPADQSTGDVYIDMIASPSDASYISAAVVHFSPGARTAWHTHPHGQTIWVSEGVGLCQREGGQVEAIRVGDRVCFEPGENHWHGAASTRFMAHVAIQQANEGNFVSFGERVSDEQYAQAPSVTEGED
jgi:quercetin dioxygenase-like cupin family protein